MIGSLAAVCVVAGAVLVGLLFNRQQKIYYQTHFFPNTYIGNLDVSEMSEEEVASIYKQMTDGESFRISVKDGSYEIPLEQIGYEVLYDGDIHDLLTRQDSDKWWEGNMSKRVYAGGVRYAYSKDLLESEIQKLPCFDEANIIHPADACIERQDRSYVLLPEVIGNELKFDQVIQRSNDVLEKGVLFVDVSDCYEQPKVYSDDEDLRKQMSKINKLQNMSIGVDVVGEIARIDQDAIFDAISVDSTGVHFDDSIVLEFVDTLPEKYNTWREPHMFRKSDGTVADVHTDNDSWGFYMDVESTKEDLLKAVKAGRGEDVVVDALWQGQYPSVRNTDQGDIGDTYVEVCLSRQHMWYYKDGNLLVETDVVTGLNSDASRRTPAGIYFVRNMGYDVTMRGSYGEAKCTYWISVTDTGVGIHDASWRSSYGNAIYEYSGSHGCINTPFDAVKVIYENISEGIPVVIYA